MAEAESEQPATEYLTVKEVAEFTGLSKAFWDQLRSRGGGPPYIRLGARVIRYRKTDINEWMASRLRRSTFDDREVAA